MNQNDCGSLFLCFVWFPKPVFVYLRVLFFCFGAPGFGVGLGRVVARMGARVLWGRGPQQRRKHKQNAKT